MNKLILLFGVLICLVAVNARSHYEEESADESSDDQRTLRPREHKSSHRRRRWQSNYGYDYPPPPPSFYYADRRDDRNNQETLQHIYRLLEDISNYIRRTPPPPPPPQPIYIPYPVAFPTRTSCKTPQTSQQNSSDPLPKRRNPFTDAMDQNRNWGFVTPAEDEYGDDDNDGARPISFEPLVPKQYMKRPAPNVEHGSQQAAYSTDAPKFAASAPLADAYVLSSSPSNVPGMCNAAILSCCGFSGDKTQQKQCFSNVGCSVSYGDGSACTSDSIQRALDSFRSAYSPVQ